MWQCRAISPTEISSKSLVCKSSLVPFATMYLVNPAVDMMLASNAYLLCIIIAKAAGAFNAAAPHRKRGRQTESNGTE